MSPSTSKAQQKAACLALAAKLGKVPVSKLHPAAKQMHDSMTVEQLSEFCHSEIKKG